MVGADRLHNLADVVMAEQPRSAWRVYRHIAEWVGLEERPPQQTNQTKSNTYGVSFKLSLTQRAVGRKQIDWRIFRRRNFVYH